MIISILFACSALIALVIAWIFRQRFAKLLPSKENVSMFCLVAPVLLLLCIGLLPDILLLVTTINLMPPTIRTIVGVVAAASILYAGCSKEADKPKPHPIHWRAPETGFTAETVPASPPNNKEGP